MTDDEISELEKRLRVAYATALKMRHATTGRVEIHMAENVSEYLKGLAVKGAASFGFPTMWGFPVVIEEDRPTNYVAVHTVEVIA